MSEINQKTVDSQCENKNISERAITDIWGNPIVVKTIQSSDFVGKTVTKTFINKSIVFTSEQKYILETILVNIRNPYLQSCNIDTSSGSSFQATFDYDVLDFDALLKKITHSNKEMSLKHTLVVLKAIVSLGAEFENNFSYLFEVSLGSLKVFSMRQKYLLESLYGFRVQNPFQNDDYLTDIVTVF